MWAAGQLLHNGTYRIESTLGRGAFGITYKALHINLNQFQDYLLFVDSILPVALLIL